MVIRIFQDRYGFMWFATLDGLNRYDGYRFTVYRHDAQDQSSITESFVQAIFEDSKGRLWIGTASGGLDLFDRETETFIHIKHQQGNANSLSPGPIQSVSEDSSGNIWVHVSDKLDKIIPPKKSGAYQGEFSIRHVRLPFYSKTSFLSITKSGHIYYVNAGAGLIYKLDEEKTRKWSVVLNLDADLLLTNKKSNGLYRIIQLVEDSVQGKFYVFHEGGAIRFNDKTGKPEKIFRNEFFKDYAAPLKASLDKDGILWFSGLTKLSLFNVHSGQLIPGKTRDPGLSQILTHTHSVFIDRSGLLWVGTSGYGLLKRNTRSENFHHTGTTSEYLIKEADNGSILIGNNQYVREIFDRASGQLTSVTQNNLPEKNIAYFNKFLFPPIAQDESRTWFVDSFRLRCYDSRLKKTTYYPYPVADNGEYAELVQCKLKDSSGNIWLGTIEGLLQFRLRDAKWTVYKNKINDASSPASNLIFSLCLDPLQPKKYLWIGTGGGGLNRMDMTTGKCISYSIKHGLPNNVVYGILSDHKGNLWLSTNKGLSCFNPQQQSFRNFDHKDGLQSNEFNRGAHCRTKDGCLFFGGVNGFNYFYPREILNNMTVPQIVITGLRIGNHPVPIQAEGSPLTKAIYLTKKLRVPYAQNFISLEFASMDYTNSEKNQYQYKLEGFQAQWINSDHTHSATYTNLDPGTYTFRVKGSNNDGTWDETGTSLELIILPPWYMTWWFRIAMVLVLLSGAYSFYRFRLGQALKLQAIRNRIAGDLHDEVGSNLSNIFIFSNVAQQKAKANDETGPLLQKITDYTQQSMEAMDDIVWMINTRNDRFENIMVRMRTLAAEFSETSGCELQLDFDKQLNDIHLNMEYRKNFYLIYKEAINNAAKYAACKNAWIEMTLHQKIITLHIRDNGRGFDLANTRKGNGLFNMKKRAELLKGNLAIKSTAGEGTSVLLSFKV
jgi:ligand-binding sensor domain-containing protein/two-component sensor histidine kinase